MGKIRAGESLPKVFRIPDAASEGRAVPDAILQQSEDEKKSAERTGAVVSGH